MLRARHWGVCAAAGPVLGWHACSVPSGHRSRAYPCSFLSARTAIITNNDTVTGKLISTPPGAAALSLGDFVMAHRHMQGIRRRAEAQWRAIARPGAGPSPL
jgi:hypothetical protein